MAAMSRSIICALLMIGNSFPLFLSGKASAQEVLGKTKQEWLALLQSDKEKPAVRKAAVIALGILGPDQNDILVAFNKSLSTDSDDQVRLQIIAILGNVDKAKLRPLLSTFADRLKEDISPAVQARIANLIGKMGENGKPALEHLEKALKNKDEQVRAESANAIGNIGRDAKESIAKLIPLFEDKAVVVRSAVVYSIVRLGPEAISALPQLLIVLEKDSSVDIRREAAKSIAFLGSPTAERATPVLVRCLGTEKEAEVRRQIVVALGKMGLAIKPHMAGIVTALKEDKDPTVRLYLVRTIAKCLGTQVKEYLPVLVERLQKDPEGSIRLIIVQELGSLETDAIAAIPALEDARSDVVLQVREAANNALARIKQSRKKK